MNELLEQIKNEPLFQLGIVCGKIQGIESYLELMSRETKTCHDTLAGFQALRGQFANQVKHQLIEKEAGEQALAAIKTIDDPTTPEQLKQYAKELEESKE